MVIAALEGAFSVISTDTLSAAPVLSSCVFCALSAPSVAGFTPLPVPSGLLPSEFCEPKQREERAYRYDCHVSFCAGGAYHDGLICKEEQ